MVSVSEFDPATVDLDGLTVIEASAGTGKTYAIQKLVRRLVVEGVPMSRVLVMSYTEAAAAELSERLRAELLQAVQEQGRSDLVARGRLERAVAEFDTAAISTIHAFCLRMLQEHPAEAGPYGLQGWTLETDAADAIRRAVLDAWGALLDGDAPLAGSVGSIKSVAEALRAALGSRGERDRVQAADFAAARGAYLAACAKLHDPVCVSAIDGVAEHFNKAASEPAGLLRAAVAQVNAGASDWWSVRASLGASAAALVKPGAVAGAIPKPAKSRAAAEAVLASAAWKACEGVLVDISAAADRVASEANLTVVREALRRLLARRHAMRQFSFDDLIQRLADAVRAESLPMRQLLRDRFGVVIVDEVQDTDPAQAAILLHAFIESPGHRTILVGDPKQSIYSFRQADVDGYLALRARSRKPLLRLNRSRRSDIGLIRGVQAVFGVAQPFQHAGIEAMDVDSIHPEPRLRLAGHGTPGLVMHHADAGLSGHDALVASAHALADELRAGWLVEEDGATRALRPADVAVLCHTHRQGQAVAETLRALGVPVMVIDRSSVYESEAAQAVAGLLAAISRPRRRALALGALALRVTGLRAVDAVERPDAWLPLLREAAADLERDGVAVALRRLAQRVPEGHGRLAVLRQRDGERFVTDFDHVLERLSQAEGDGVRGASALAAWLAARIEGLGRGDKDSCRSLGSVDAVTVMTIHGSKGLTFGVAWLPTFLMKDKRDARAGDPEPRRLLYVAMTRARYRTHVVWRGHVEAERSPFAELVHGRALQQGETVGDRLSDGARGLADLQALAATEPQAIALRPLAGHARAGDAAAMACELLPARTLDRRPERSVVLSFTSLSRVKTSAEQVAERDVGQVVERAADRRGPVGALDRLLRDTGLQGAALGVMVHDALAEQRAFACLAPHTDTTALAEALAHEARGHRVREPQSLVRLAAGLQVGLAAPTGDAQIPSAAQLAANPEATLREIGLAVPWLGAPSQLADAMRDERAPWSEPVAEAIRRADVSRLRGVLIGFVDLVGLHAGQWFIHDYKTNFLGDDPAAYEGDRLHEAMADALYPLQAAVYALMLARWLRTRRVVNAFDDAIGGVAYLFLRGMDPSAGARGTWTWRPSSRLLRALDEALPPVPAEVAS